MLKFIGYGAIFNNPTENTSGFIKTKDNLILIDVGVTAYSKVLDDIMDGVKTVHLFITHTQYEKIVGLYDLLCVLRLERELEVKIYTFHAERVEDYLDINSRLRDIKFRQDGIICPVSHGDSTEIEDIIITVEEGTYDSLIHSMSVIIHDKQSDTSLLCIGDANNHPYDNFNRFMKRYRP